MTLPSAVARSPNVLVVDDTPEDRRVAGRWSRKSLAGTCRYAEDGWSRWK